MGGFLAIVLGERSSRRKGRPETGRHPSGEQSLSRSSDNVEDPDHRCTCRETVELAVTNERGAGFEGIRTMGVDSVGNGLHGEGKIGNVKA